VGVTFITTGPAWEQSDVYSAIFSDFYEAHRRRSQHASDCEVDIVCALDSLPYMVSVNMLKTLLDISSLTLGWTTP
jgi:hypothetical protein